MLREVSHSPAQQFVNTGNRDEGLLTSQEELQSMEIVSYKFIDVFHPCNP
jgi:hypothetical protein